MAITKFIKIRTRLDNCINYAVNPEKTEIENVLKYIGNAEKTAHSVYVTTFNCSRENAYKEMSEMVLCQDNGHIKPYFLGKSAKCTKWSHLFHGLLDNEPLMA